MNGKLLSVRNTVVIFVLFAVIIIAGIYFHNRQAKLAFYHSKFDFSISFPMSYNFNTNIETADNLPSPFSLNDPNNVYFTIEYFRNIKNRPSNEYAYPGEFKIEAFVFKRVDRTYGDWLSRIDNIVSSRDEKTDYGTIKIATQKESDMEGEGGYFDCVYMLGKKVQIMAVVYPSLNKEALSVLKTFNGDAPQEQ